MKNVKMGKFLPAFARIFWSGCLAGELAVALDLAMGMLGRPISPVVFLAVAAVLLGALLLVRMPLKSRRRWALGVPVALALLLVLSWAGWRGLSEGLVYENPDDGKAALYGNRRVMVIVPHEDDELNIAGGVLEEYTRYGSQVTVVFVTNGDYLDQGEARLNEAIAVCAGLGIDEENVIFLGYGDQWAEGGPHIYNAEPGTGVASHIGYTQTYGSEAHPAYRTGRAYTRENLLEDMESVLLEYQPDTILCSDYDDHIDHKAVSMLFEEAMGNLLHAHPEYRPMVYKAYAYSTAWYARNDFNSYINLGSTRTIYGGNDSQSPAVYPWENRLRLPVAADSLSRLLIATGNYQGMDLYVTQRSWEDVRNRAGAMTNSDKVFWQRRTDSVCYGAEISVSSGDGGVLTDFKLLDCHDLAGGGLPYDGVWTGDGTDDAPTLRVILPEARDLAQIVLYDNPDPDQNVAEATVTFDDGTVISAGPLEPEGAATVIPLEKTGVREFSVTLTRRQGDRAGLTEVEAYTVPAQSRDRYCKLVDGEGTFVYDYWLDLSGAQRFTLWTCGDVPERLSDYRLTCQGGEIQVEEDWVTVTCPRGKRCVLTLETPDGEIRDTVVFRNPGKLARFSLRLLRKLEENALNTLPRTVSLRTCSWIKRRVG